MSFETNPNEGRIPLEERGVDEAKAARERGGTLPQAETGASYNPKEEGLSKGVMASPRNALEELHQGVRKGFFCVHFCVNIQLKNDG